MVKEVEVEAIVTSEIAATRVTEDKLRGVAMEVMQEEALTKGTVTGETITITIGEIINRDITTGEVKVPGMMAKEAHSKAVSEVKFTGL